MTLYWKMRPVFLIFVIFPIVLTLYGAPNGAHAQSDFTASCDRLAASRYDDRRPAGVAGVFDGGIDTGRAVPACRKAVESSPDEIRFVYELGRAYDDMDDQRAVPLMRRAAKAGHPGAMRSLGIYYRLGFGVPRDLTRAVAYFRASARAGNPQGANNLGAMYAGGEGVRKNAALAMKWVNVAADAGVPWAMINLGDFRQIGLGASQDMSKALAWYKKAYAIPHPYARPAAAERIAYIHLHGEAGEIDRQKARTWFERARSAGSRTADAGLAAVGALGDDAAGRKAALDYLMKAAPKLTGH